MSVQEVAANSSTDNDIAASGDVDTNQLQQHQEPVHGAENVVETSVAADAIDEDDRKLFVGGLSQDSTSVEVTNHFAQFGKVADVTMKIDMNTGRSRGFAFVTFETIAEMEAALNTSTHTIKDRKLIVRKAEAKPGKIYVARLKLEFTEEDIKSHFEQYGTVTSIEQPYDKYKGEKRNYCFVNFAKEAPAIQLLKEGSTIIKGQECDIRKVNTQGAMGRGQGFMPGGFSGMQFGMGAMGRGNSMMMPMPWAAGNPQMMGQGQWQNPAANYMSPDMCSYGQFYGMNPMNNMAAAAAGSVASPNIAAGNMGANNSASGNTGTWNGGMASAGWNTGNFGNGQMAATNNFGSPQPGYSAQNYNPGMGAGQQAAGFGAGGKAPRGGMRGAFRGRGVFGNGRTRPY